MVALCTRLEVRGMENFPPRGPALIVFNHLGDADVVLGVAVLPKQVEALSKAELRDYPVLGWILEAYGVIWVHRGLPDRKALKMALKGLQEGRILAIAPEGRESLTGSLEEGTGGAAYLALKSGVPILPITVTGTENVRIYQNLRHFRRSNISLTIGILFHLESMPDRQEAVRQGTQTIMYKLAQQLPPEYRGVYQTGLE